MNRYGVYGDSFLSRKRVEVFISSSDLALVEQINRDVRYTVSHKFHNEQCNCDEREIHGLRAQLMLLLKNGSPQSIAEELALGFFPRSLKLLKQEYPEITTDTCELPWQGAPK